MHGSNKSENQKEKTTQLSITPTVAVAVAAAHITPYRYLIRGSNKVLERNLWRIPCASLWRWRRRRRRLRLRGWGMGFGEKENDLSVQLCNVTRGET